MQEEEDCNSHLDGKWWVLNKAYGGACQGQLVCACGPILTIGSYSDAGASYVLQDLKGSSGLSKLWDVLLLMLKIQHELSML